MDNDKYKPVRLLKEGKKGFWNLVFSRMTLVILLILLQAAVLFSAFFRLERFLPHILGGQLILTVAMVLALLNSRMDPTAKITWLVMIMAAPVFGSLLYFFTSREWGYRAMKRRVRQIREQTKGALAQDADSIASVQEDDPGRAALAAYVYKDGGFPLWGNTEVTYFSQGEEKFQRLLSELEKAEKFIFLEYFIIEEGKMWGSILDVLRRKAKEGVDVRVMYDGTCEFMLLPKDYPKMLRKLGIRCKVFSPFIPLFSTHYNYRDHRKIAVIDGHTAFTGGVNLADEYINEVPKYGHWKDTAVMLKGEAVKSFGMMFLQMWSMDERTPELKPVLSEELPKETPGYVMPYGDDPLTGAQIGRRVYLDILNRAKNYVHIMTPYLILDQEMENTLKYAAARGVQVRLILPGIPDKEIPFALAKTHYARLL